MLTYPQINPVAIEIGFIKVHWYGLMYLLGFLCAWLLAKHRMQTNRWWSKEKLSDLLFYCVLGVMVGGRLGYVLFYHPEYLVTNPLQIFYIWQGGMSFHGGLLGVIAAMYFFHRKFKIKLLEIFDFVAPVAPIGLGLGRIGNFIGGELYGRVTNVPWGMVFPHAGNLPRHPSQLYQAALEGVMMFIILWWFSAKPRPNGAVAGLFLILYSFFRIVVECFRQPDAHLGFIAYGWLTMGQFLSIAMFIAGVIFLFFAYNKKVNQLP